MSLDLILGQDDARRVLSAAFARGRVPHAYLFVGPEGVGKRFAARQWAKTVLCPSKPAPEKACGACPSCRKAEAGQHPDVLWIDFERQALFLDEEIKKQRTLKIDMVREMERSLRFKAFESAGKVAVLDPADRLEEAAAHALLKILEEPPSGTHLILLAADGRQLLPTIRSRCQWARFRPLPSGALGEILRAQAPGQTPEALDVAARAAEGSVSRALSLLQETEGTLFDWENAPIGELAAWFETLAAPKTGRAAAEDFLRALLPRFRAEAAAGRRDPGDMERALRALHQLRQNVTPALVVQVLVVSLRRNKRRARALTAT